MPTRSASRSQYYQTYSWWWTLTSDKLKWWGYIPLKSCYLWWVTASLHHWWFETCTDRCCCSPGQTCWSSSTHLLLWRFRGARSFGILWSDPFRCGKVWCACSTCSWTSGCGASTLRRRFDADQSCWWRVAYCNHVHYWEWDIEPEILVAGPYRVALCKTLRWYTLPVAHLNVLRSTQYHSTNKRWKIVWSIAYQNHRSPRSRDSCLLINLSLLFAQFLFSQLVAFEYRTQTTQKAFYCKFPDRQTE